MTTDPTFRDRLAEALWKAEGYDFAADPKSRTAREWVPEFRERADALIESGVVADPENLAAPLRSRMSDLTAERDAALAKVARVEALVRSEQAEKFRDEACRHVVEQPYADNRYVRLLDDLRAALADTGADER